MRDQFVAVQRRFELFTKSFPALYPSVIDPQNGCPAGLVRASRPFYVIIGFGPDASPVFPAERDHGQQVLAGISHPHRFDHGPVEPMAEGHAVCSVANPQRPFCTFAGQLILECRRESPFCICGFFSPVSLLARLVVFTRPEAMIWVVRPMKALGLDPDQISGDSCFRDDLAGTRRRTREQVLERLIEGQKPIMGQREVGHCDQKMSIVAWPRYVALNEADQEV